tara:strand:- start:2186 stop:2398 length:213 start_codon:yes stop_codon:yes gene_type:complete
MNERSATKLERLICPACGFRWSAMLVYDSGAWFFPSDGDQCPICGEFADTDGMEEAWDEGRHDNGGSASE